MTGDWEVTDAAHNLCVDCENCVESAIVHASVTGSIGATWRVTRLDGGRQHWATVARATT
jgi:hypothetical protein